MGYGIDLADKQYQVIKNILDSKEHKHKDSLRSICVCFLFTVN